MSHLNKKLTLFDYIIGKFNAWHKEENSPEPLTFTRCIKLLYFTCLASVDEENSEGLFRTFNNFSVYDRGPVENNLMNNRIFLFNYYFQGEILRSKGNNTEIERERKQKYQNNLAKYRSETTIIASIDTTISKLKKQVPNLVNMDTDSLVNLSFKVLGEDEMLNLLNPVLSNDHLQEKQEIFYKELSTIRV